MPNLKKIALSVALASSLMLAAEPDVKKDDALVTHTELGYIETQGNTKTKTFNLDAKAKKGWGRNIFTLTFDGQYAADQDVETKNKYFLELEYDYEITDRFAFNYLAGYKADKFSGFAYQFYTGPGAKYKAIVSDNHNLSIDGNLLYAKDSFDAVYTDPVTGDIISYPTSTTGATLGKAGYDDQYASYRLKGVYAWQVLENLKFDQELSWRGSFETSNNYFIFSKSALTSKLSDMFSAGISYKVDYAQIPATGKEDTDTTFTANLIIDY